MRSITAPTTRWRLISKIKLRNAMIELGQSQEIFDQRREPAAILGHDLRARSAVFRSSIAPSNRVST